MIQAANQTAGAQRPPRKSAEATSAKPARPKKVGPAEPAPQAEEVTPAGKLGVMVGLLRRREGVRIDELAAATSWQVHSVRGALAGALKKKHGLTITSEKTEGVRSYRIVPGAPA